MNIYWGDLHNHCAASYGKGTPPRALANAEQHLDFCTITGHAFWPDLPMDLVSQDAIIGVHLGGFAKLQYYWPQLLSQLRDANRPGRFVTLPSYEWHSMKYGDHNCYFNADDVPLIDAESPAALVDKLRGVGHDFMVLPHHIGYARGFRGLNWDCFDPAHSPLIEIFSNHGCGEADDAPYEYHHSMGPRVGMSLARQGLQLGHKVGFYASSDSHDGYPGHYGHGRVGVIADRLDRNAIWQALKARRTIASTGARIQAEVTLDDATIGEVTGHRQAMSLRLMIEGVTSLDQIELIHGGADGWRVRRLPVPELDSSFTPGRHKIRVETGWGRGDAQSTWHVQARVRHGRLVGVTPYFRYGGYTNAEQKPTDRLLEVTADSATWTCRARANPSGQFGGTHFNAGGTQSVVLEVEAGETTALDVETGQSRLSFNLPDLARQSAGMQVNGFGSSAFKVHRAIPAREYTVTQSHQIAAIGDWGFTYLRIRQTDGQAAWTSPIWYE